MRIEGINEVMLFPYNNDMVNLVKFRDQLGFTIRSIVSPKSWGYEGKDPLRINQGVSSGYTIGTDFEGELDRVDTVVMGSFERYHDAGDICETCIKIILARDKNLIFLEHRGGIDLLSYKEKFEASGKKLIAFVPKLKDLSMQKPVRLPVIGVFGTEEDCGKLEMELLLYRGLRQLGYRVSMLSANKQLVLLGGHVYPHSIFEAATGELDKIKSVRAFANQIISSERPDILLISAPFGVSRLGEDEDIDYRYNGILSHIILDAIRPDLSFLCINTGRDPRHGIIAKKALESLTCGCVAALSAKRYNKRLTQSLYRSENALKAGILRDKQFDELAEYYSRNWDTRLLDQDKLTPAEAARYITDALSIGRKFGGII